MHVTLEKGLGISNKRKAVSHLRFSTSKLYKLFADYVFVDDEKGDVNTSLHSSY